jgi:hypothetical protein
MQEADCGVVGDVSQSQVWIQDSVCVQCTRFSPLLWQEYLPSVGRLEGLKLDNLSLRTY